MREELKDSGLSDEEINIYLCLLENRPLKVTEIARKLNLARTTVYRFITSLHEKGLVNEFVENNAKTYSPLDPKLLPSLMQTKVDQVTRIIPSLEKLSSKGESTNVTVYRGKSGLKAVMNDILETNKPYTTFGAIEKYFEDVELYTHIWMRKATKKKIRGRLLNHKIIPTSKHETLRLLPKRLISETTTVTFGSKTAIFVWKKPHYIILIDDEKVTKGNRQVFEEFYKTASPVQPS